MLTKSAQQETIYRDSNWVSWTVERVRMLGHQHIRASYDLTTVLLGGVVRLRLLEVVRVNFLINENALTRTHPYPFQQGVAGTLIRPVCQSVVTAPMPAP